MALFDHAVGWLRRNRVLLPGVTVLARQVAAAREAAEARLYEALAAAARSVDPGLPERLANLLQVPDGSRFSELERLRRAPRRSSGPEMVKALQRAEQLAALGVGRVGVEDIPANRLQVLARTGWGARLRRWPGWASRSGPRRWWRWCGTWRRPRSTTRWTCSRC